MGTCSHGGWTFRRLKYLGKKKPVVWHHLVESSCDVCFLRNSPTFWIVQEEKDSLFGAEQQRKARKSSFYGVHMLPTYVSVGLSRGTQQYLPSFGASFTALRARPRLFFTHCYQVGRTLGHMADASKTGLVAPPLRPTSHSPRGTCL